ncbi:MAG: hypothetical protein K9N47_28565 [Prosthecobacter sp.]|uniref:hypothetical protein n=1 Tax=Prosthecobacter sp. TaxID=1965333 RepID=UPI00260D8229|nr:hypothetical protein [Prosthecobacter sp.]MCF7790105.1 hypothetical protein [Prosthecobacter sp.]
MPGTICAELPLSGVSGFLWTAQHAGASWPAEGADFEYLVVSACLPAFGKR